jgi:hypothetical protein
VGPQFSTLACLNLITSFITPFTMKFHRTTIEHPSHLPSTSDRQLDDDGRDCWEDESVTVPPHDLGSESTHDHQYYVLHKIDDPHIPVVVDTVASIRVTPNTSDLPVTLISGIEQKIMSVSATITSTANYRYMQHAI